jgi:hypothetical protein
LEASLQGQPQAFAAGTLNAAHSHRLKCTADLLAVGLGAFGQGPDDTQGRFGEALAVAGTAVMMPTDGSSVPDYQVTEDQLVPELHLLYGLTARGNFSKLLRFEASRSARGVLSLAELVDTLWNKRSRLAPDSQFWRRAPASSGQRCSARQHLRQATDARLSWCA